MARALESEQQEQMVGVTSLPSDAIKRVVLRLSTPHLQQTSHQPAHKPLHVMHASSPDAFRFAMSPVRDHISYLADHEVTVSPPSKSPKHNVAEGRAHGHRGMRSLSPVSVSKIYNISSPHKAEMRPYEGRSSSSSSSSGYGSSGHKMSMRAHSDDQYRRSPTRSSNKKSNSKTSLSRSGDEEDDFSHSVVEPSLRGSNSMNKMSGLDKGIALTSSSDAGAHAAFKVSRYSC